jgi:hypothetical protein
MAAAFGLVMIGLGVLTWLAARWALAGRRRVTW